MAPHSSQASTPAKPAGLISHKSQGGELDYFAYVPQSAAKNAPLLVSVHGIDRMALQHALRFAPLAEEGGFAVLAPLFSRRRMPRYQRTLRTPRGESPLEAFDLTLEHFSEGCSIDPRTRYLFGYSGGAQFAMRYGLRGRNQFAKLALAAPGWFTMPDPGLPFPFGVAPSVACGLPQPDIERLLAMPILVTVGSRDTKRDRSLNRDPIVDATQGFTRVQRAESWCTAMRAISEQRGVTSRLQMRILPGASHDFEDNMTSHGLGRIVCEWFQEQANH
jgi:poly(3-hydroxybutyrate) depolymerase